MPLQVIDYSDVYYRAFAGGEVPPARQGKFVLMTDGGQWYAVFSVSKLTTYHTNIVERFLAEHGVTGNYDEEKGVFRYHAPAWKVLGGGRWDLDEEAGRLIIFSKSGAYGGVALEELADQLQAVGAFGGIEVLSGLEQQP